MAIAGTLMLLTILIYYVLMLINPILKWKWLCGLFHITPMFYSTTYEPEKVTKGTCVRCENRITFNRILNVWK